MCQALISLDTLCNFVKYFFLFPALTARTDYFYLHSADKEPKAWIQTSIFTQGHPWRHQVVKPESTAIFTYLHCHFA